MGDANSQPPTTQTFNVANHGQGGFVTGHGGTGNTNTINNSPNQSLYSVNNSVGNIQVSGNNNRATGNVVNIGKPPSS